MTTGHDDQSLEPLSLSSFRQSAFQLSAASILGPAKSNHGPLLPAPQHMYAPMQIALGSSFALLAARAIEVVSRA